MLVNKKPEIISKSIKKLNPESDRYRICPECKIPFMADHRSRDFHPGKCADDYNNRKKKLAKQAQEMSSSVSSNELIQIGNSQDLIIEPTSEVANSLDDSKLNSDVTETLPIQKTSSLNTSSCANELILVRLLDGQREIEVSWTIVSERGFDFNAYNSIEKLPHCELNKANYGAYSILWTQADKILITNQKHLLWTSIQ
ncbi:MAG: hypothetical protein QNL60_03055 [Flavobacteriales bacterium]